MAAVPGFATRGPQGGIEKRVQSEHRKKLRKCLVKERTTMGPKKRKFQDFKICRCRDSVRNNEVGSNIK